MKATTLTPAEVFGNQIRYVVPLYQRPYVWSLEAQWQPLWDDVSALADRVLEAPIAYGAAPVPPHFLGAIVIDHLPGPVTHIGARSVIDGQQRLTTLQLLLDAAQEVVANYGRPIDASALRVIVQNNVELAVNPDHVFKVWPTDRDQPAYRAAMRDDLTPTGELAKAAIARAHQFFKKAVAEWARVDEAPVEARERLAALTNALREKLKLVVIDLEPGDNAQVIFETLNHRGAPLLAADLVKNLLFQVAAAQGLDVETLYAKFWRDLDGDYWRQLISRGRRFDPRIDVFMQRWLVMKLRRDVPADRVFTEFRDNIVAKPDVDIAALFEEIAADAAVHRSWDALPESSVAGRFGYRVLQALDTQVIAPVFLWLTRYGPDTMPPEQQDRALRALESWLVRRALTRATSKDYNNVVIDLLRALERGGPAVAGESTEGFFAGQSAESRYWPSDERVAVALADERIYKTMTRSRLRMVLEALEEDLRGPLGEGQPVPKGLTIEHVMPVAWREHWGADVANDPIAGIQRDDRIQTLGNLTLVNGKLNPTLSNRPWTDAEAHHRGLGNRGKRDYLLQHSELKLNAALVYENPQYWGEEQIGSRTTRLVDRLLAIWPCPPDAAQPMTTVTAAELVTADSDLEKAPIAPWSTSPEDVELAARMWLALNVTSRRIFQILIEVAPQRFAAPELARRLELETGVAGMAGHLSRPARIAAELGREFPVSWIEAEPSEYWIEERVAATFEAAIQLATSEDFAAQLAQESQQRVRPASTASGGGRRSVPRHILEVFAVYPPDAELTVRQIAAAESTEYSADEISQGAIAAALNRRGVEGIEVVPGSSPLRARRRRNSS